MLDSEKQQPDPGASHAGTSPANRHIPRNAPPFHATMPVVTVAFDLPTGTWTLNAAGSTYALRLVDGQLAHVHWGPPLDARSLPARAEVGARQGEGAGFDGTRDGTEEYAYDGGVRHGVPSLQVRFADGTRALELEYATHAIDGSSLVISLRDRHYPLDVSLHYRVVGDVIERHVVVRNRGAELTLLRFDSATWVVPQLDAYRVSHVTGMWGAETQLERVAVPVGEVVFTSRRGITSHQANPWAMVDDGSATEAAGAVWAVALAWSGSWRLTVQRTPLGRVSVSTGFGHDGVSWRLAPGEELTTPITAGLYTSEGFGAASRAWHEYARREVLPHPDELRPVLFNSWEATLFDISAAQQASLASAAAGLGVELFVVDDGWFRPGRDDRAGLGDWVVNRSLFPEGLAPLAAHVRQLGMDFGIWVEPEMVNPGSDLYRVHADWTLHYPNRARSELRHQLVLNFARDDVRTWAYVWLDALLRDTDAAFLKWDMNRVFTEAGWPGAPDPERQWIEHTRGVYEVMDRLRAAHPRVRIESCSGGGGRLDLGILARTDQVWASDNTDPSDRLRIQYGFTQAYPPSVLAAWVTDSPNTLTGRSTPLRFRFHVAMTGVLGVGGNVSEWTAAERSEAAGLIAQYKRIRPIVQHGELCRLRPPGELCALQYVLGDAVVVFVFREAPRLGLGVPRLRLAGLPDRARYRDVDSGAVYPAAQLTGSGLPVELPLGEYASVLVHLRREP